MIANIAYYHSRIIPMAFHDNIKAISDNEKITTAKLIALLKLADALDKSHLQKIRNLHLIVLEGVIQVQAETDSEPYLEEWAFQNRSDYFQDVFGFRLELKVVK